MVHLKQCFNHCIQKSVSKQHVKFVDEASQIKYKDTLRISRIKCNIMKERVTDTTWNRLKKENDGR